MAYTVSLDSRPIFLHRNSLSNPYKAEHTLERLNFEKLHNCKHNKINNRKK